MNLLANKRRIERLQQNLNIFARLLSSSMILVLLVSCGRDSNQLKDRFQTGVQLRTEFLGLWLEERKNPERVPTWPLALHRYSLFLNQLSQEHHGIDLTKLSKSQEAVEVCKGILLSLETLAALRGDCFKGSYPVCSDLSFLNLESQQQFYADGGCSP